MSRVRDRSGFSHVRRTFHFFRSAALIAVGASLATLIFMWLAAGEIYDYRDTFSVEQDSADVDVILVLAGGKGRIKEATEVWSQITKIREQQKLSPPSLFFSGVGPSAGWDTLVEQGVDAAILKVLTRDRLVFENVSENTYENAQIFSSFARQNRWRTVVLVTASYHMRRSVFILNQTMDSDVNVKIHTVGAKRFGRNQWHQDWYSIRVTLMEYMKWLYYRYSYSSI